MLFLWIFPALLFWDVAHEALPVEGLVPVMVSLVLLITSVFRRILFSVSAALLVPLKIVSICPTVALIFAVELRVEHVDHPHHVAVPHNFVYSANV